MFIQDPQQLQHKSQLIHALEMQQRLAQRVFDNTIEGIFVTGPYGHILEVNRAFTEITGYTADEALGKTPRLLRSNHHDETFYRRMWEQIETSGSWQGEIWNRRKDGGAYLQWLSINALKGPDGTVEYYVAVFHDLSELRARDAEIEYLATHDPLTGLGNRRQLLDWLDYHLSEAKTVIPFALIKIDLGEIQLINDSLGHAAGDRLIQLAANRLKPLVSAKDCLVRISADEFGLIIPLSDDSTHLAQILFNLKAALQKSFSLSGETLFMSPSLGVALFPEDADSQHELLRCAKAALEEAKSAGRNTFCFYNHSMSNQARDRLALEQALREALAGDGLSLHFQPKVTLATQAICGAEVLVRWSHPVLGPISPAIFIPLAERSGLMVELGAWVVNEACRQVSELLQAGITLPSVAINLSVQELERLGVAEFLADTLERYGLQPSMFEFEVTETSLIHREKVVIDVLQRLREQGFGVALDDFGTGYSSLSYLRKLPLSTLKIDRSFVVDMTEDEVSASIVQTIISLAENLNLHLVAEGVETIEQRDRLMEMGCDTVQGYLYYRPMDLQEFTCLLSSSNAIDQ